MAHGPPGIELGHEVPTASAELVRAHLGRAPAGQRRGSGVQDLGTPQGAAAGVTQHQPVAVTQRQRGLGA